MDLKPTFLHSMACGLTPGNFDGIGSGFSAALVCEGTARVERTTGGRCERAWNLAAHGRANLTDNIEARDGIKQHSGIGMARLLEEGLSIPDFDQAA